MRKLIGHFCLGTECVQLYASTETADGHAQFPGRWNRAGDVRIGRITIGVEGLEWKDVVDNLLHETAEYILARIGTRFIGDNRASNSTGHALFVFDHDQFTEVCARQAEFIAPALPELAEFYNKHVKKRRKK